MEGLAQGCQDGRMPEADETPKTPGDDPAGNAGSESKAAKIASDPRLIAAARALRKALPGDSSFGDDPLSTAGPKSSQQLGRRLAEATSAKPSVLREAGLTALQVWDALGQSAGRIPVKADLTIVFTDLVEFSKWSLEAGDASAVELLRKVSAAIEPPVGDNTGKVVKRLGDGMMAVFASPTDALDAVTQAQARLEDVEVHGYRPVLRAGMHVGRPERVGDDYFGVDVNIAARVAEAASGGEILASDKVLAELDPDTVKARRKRLFRAKGVPPEVKVFSVTRA
jgi:adenylate cyclase